MSQSKILWQESFEMNIDIIDVQHKNLLDMINELNQNDTIFNNDKSINEFIGKLKDYTHYHFDTEEKLMSDYQIAGLEEHQKLHQKIIQKLGHVISTYEDNPVELLKNMNILLSEWFVDHLLYEDKVIAQTLAGKYNKELTQRY